MKYRKKGRQFVKKKPLSLPQFFFVAKKKFVNELRAERSKEEVERI